VVIRWTPTLVYWGSSPVHRVLGGSSDSPNQWSPSSALPLVGCGLLSELSASRQRIWVCGLSRFSPGNRRASARRLSLRGWMDTQPLVEEVWVASAVHTESQLLCIWLLGPLGTTVSKSECSKQAMYVAAIRCSHNCLNVLAWYLFISRNTSVFLVYAMGDRKRTQALRG